MFTAGPGRGAALLAMVRVLRSPENDSLSTDVINIKGPGTQDLWKMRYHPQNASVDCIFDESSSIASSPGYIRMDEWYIVSCHLNNDDQLSLRVNGREVEAPEGMPVSVGTVPNVNFQMVDPQADLGHVRARVDIEVSAFIVHDKMLSGLESEIINSHMLEYLSAAYPDVQDACPGAL